MGDHQIQVVLIDGKSVVFTISDKEQIALKSQLTQLAPCPFLVVTDTSGELHALNTHHVLGITTPSTVHDMADATTRTLMDMHRNGIVGDEVLLDHFGLSKKVIPVLGNP